MSVPLRIEGITKSYGHNKVLRGISGMFEPRRVSAVVGPNGAGKTTLLRVMASLQSRNGGLIDAPFPPTYYGGFDTIPVRGKVDDLFAAVGLRPKGDRRRLSALSRGELQQQGLDIVFGLSPRVLLLDEPWTALEPHIREELNRRLLDFAARDAIVICSSHDLDEVVRVADDVLFLDAGSARWSTRESRGGRPADRDELLSMFPQRTSSGRPD